MGEREFHQLQADAAGVPCRRVVPLAGRWFALRKPRLPVLLRYLAASMPRTDPAEAMVMGGAAAAEREEQHHQTVMFAAMHRLLEESIRASDWPGLQDTALASKAGTGPVLALVRAVVEEQTAWPYWPAVRLLGYLAGSLAERDGDMLREGRSLAALTPRQACNRTYSVLLAQRQSEEDRDQFKDDLFFDGNPEADALAAVRAMQAARKAETETGDPEAASG
jgi:hypothetical protein